MLEPERTWRDKTKCLYYKFKETLLPLDASIDFDELKELEAHVNYESFMKESLACETVHKTRNSTLDIFWVTRLFCSDRWSSQLFRVRRPHS